MDSKETKSFLSQMQAAYPAMKLDALVGRGKFFLTAEEAKGADHE